MNEFYNRVITQDPRFHSEERVADLALLEPATREKILNLMAAAKAKGIELFVFETYRSEQRQLELFRQGGSKLKTVGGHHYGLACDLFKNNRAGKSDDDNKLLEQIAREQGLFFGSELRKDAVKFTFFDPDGLELMMASRTKRTSKNEPASPTAKNHNQKLEEKCRALRK